MGLSDTWHQFQGVNEIDHLEDYQTHIYTDYDHISDLIQVGTKSKLVVPKIAISLYIERNLIYVTCKTLFKKCIFN